MSKYGPPQKELRFRLLVSLAGLVLLVGAVVYRGWPKGIAGAETIVIATLFFGGSLGWSLYLLWRNK